MKTFNYEDIISVNGVRYEFNSIVSYAIASGDCPMAAVAQCEAAMVKWPHSGHKLHWLGQCVVAVHNGTYDKPEVTPLSVGDMVKFQGHTFTLEARPNENMALVKV